ncbi:dead deah box DNA helicase [Sporothrix brasiliensis 5110]|uniref:DNA 3'-5' helicase n=1 Tax=Sporothrix brasiliensis 5110 TaxID=1398154 RepID=A0A0C2FCE2_9PEZI|nr:dead deah box DNA helicase [Sporothrix brasiliensis 5110]KIH88793.1 dead deah box DNA helicase [Sporothrix brasiliensis 5110]
MQTPRRQTIQSHNPLDQPGTPWSIRPTARPNWLRQPPQEPAESFHTPIYGYSSDGPQRQQQEFELEPDTGLEPQPYGPPVYNSYNRRSENHYKAPPTPAPPATFRQRSRQAQLMAPPTPRHSSPSPLAVVRAPIQPRNNPAPQVNGIELISPQAVDKRFQAVFPYEHFNAMQSRCFSSVYGSSYNVVVAAPTGSGKTVVFELAIYKLLASRDKKDFKIVYLAPTKALCAERVRDWQNKFKPLGLQVAEFTGDTTPAEVRRARTASVIITTPEKWDSITRKWSDHDTLLRTIKLVLIDEVHILKDPRGATLETVVSRMKTLGGEVRFVALSATISNSTDVAQWLGLTHTSPQVPAKTYVCGEEFRPVRLEKIVIGYNMGGGNEHSLDSILDDQLPDLVVKYAEGKPVLVFCFTRKSTESAATALAEYWGMCSAAQKPWPSPSVGIRSSARLQNLVTAGVAFHHGGLERHDRASIEAAFLRGHLSIVCCTSTLAVGVNLPCHTVILKGTLRYHNGKFSEYDECEVMQMIGRAGRPQFDTSATAIILTRAENKERYENIESGYQTVESTLHMNLIEHLNSEIVLGTITSLPKAVQWLRGTFLSVRLRQNPDHYKLTDETTLARTTDEQLREICKAGIDRLAEVRLIQYLADSDAEFRGTPHGGAMSTYMVRFETMVMMLKLNSSVSMEELVNALCHASEFDELRIKSTERQGLRELNKSQDIPFKFKDNIMETWQKISVLIQVELARGVLPYQQRMALEARQAIERMQRLLESYIVCMIADNNGHAAKIGLDFSRSLLAKAWEGFPAQLCQVPDIGPANMKKLVDKQVTTVLAFADLGTVTIERFLSKNPPAAMKIADSLRAFPRLTLDGHVAMAPEGLRENGSRDSETEAKAVARVKFGCMNEGGIPRWRHKVPSATFLALTEEGRLLHIWRGKLQEKKHEVTFTVPSSDADTVHSCVDVPRDGLAVRSPPTASTRTDSTAAPNDFVLRGYQEERPAKRQKMLDYSMRTITIGNTTVDCVDLSAVDDAEGGRVPQAQTTHYPVQYHRDPFALEAVSTRQPRHCSGGGTQQDPLLLDDSGSDEYEDTFDASIFDDIELAPIKESPESTPFNSRHRPSDTRCKSSGIRPVKTSPADTILPKRTPSKVAAALAPPVFNMHHIDTLIENEIIPDSRRNSPQPEVMPSHHAVATRESSKLDGAVSATAVPQSPCSMSPGPQGVITDQPDSLPKGDEATDTVAEEGPESELSLNVANAEPAEPEEPAEPSWVHTSSSSIVDFLRGHVKFV